MSGHSNKWTGRFMHLAQHISNWSKDPRTKVGAVIVADGNKIVSLGYNGLPAHIPFEEQYLFDREMKNAMTIHAEANAIAFAMGRASGCAMYVTHPPCSQCAAMIIQSGIKGVCAARSPEMESGTIWSKSIALAQDMFAAAGVEFYWYKEPLTFESMEKSGKESDAWFERKA